MYAFESWVKNAFWAVSLILCVIIAALRRKRLYSTVIREKGTMYDIEPLRDFDWTTETPHQLRPFKSKYHLTMAISSCRPSELLLMDQTYRSQLDLRRDILKNHTDDVLATNSVAISAVYELYRYLTAVYLPIRFPTMFKTTSSAECGFLENLVTREIIPIEPPSDPIVCLRHLGEQLDQEFFLLLPHETKTAKSNEEVSNEKEEEYRLEAFVCCSASGFNPAKKLGKSLAGIHAPVPGYASKLERSMDRFFSKLPIDKVYKRANWSVHMTSELYVPDEQNRFVKEPESGQICGEQIPQSGCDTIVSEIDPAACLLRCERQTVHRMPKTGAIVFSFKTYMYTLSQIKEDGLGEELASAIEGLSLGNIPEMTKYKGSAIWENPVKHFLRS